MIDADNLNTVLISDMLVNPRGRIVVWKFWRGIRTAKPGKVMLSLLHFVGTWDPTSPVSSTLPCCRCVRRCQTSRFAWRKHLFQLKVWKLRCFKMFENRVALVSWSGNARLGQNSSRVAATCTSAARKTLRVVSATWKNKVNLRSAMPSASWNERTEYGFSGERNRSLRLKLRTKFLHWDSCNL